MERTQAKRARFAGFELDLRAGELHGNGEPTLLSAQVLQVLQILIEHDGDIVTREEIKKRLWPNDTIVEFDFGINNTIKNLRRALGDSAEHPSYIETIPRRGYRLLVPVEWISAVILSEDSAAADDESKDLHSPDASSVEKSSADSSGDSEAPLKAKLKAGSLTGKVVSHYRVLEVIGGGGMGLVYRAEDLKLGRAVALKFLPEEVGDDPKARERFEREAHAVSALDHPNICTVYDFDEHEGHPFIAMQLLQGKTLRDYISDGRFRLTQPEGLEIAIQIASGLEAAHEKGIIHRDIKPANIFITEKNVAKILDFGVAKVLSVVETSESPHPGKGSRNGVPEVGGPHFLALGRQSDPAGNEPRSGDCEVSPGWSPPGRTEPRVGGSILNGRGDQSPAGLILAQASEGDGLGTPEGVPFQGPGLKPGEQKDAQRRAEARLYHPDAATPAGTPAKESTLTRTGMKLGTAGYMSPEQIRGEPLDARTDIFSFGLVLYEMATGERAFTGETEGLLHDAIQNRDPKPVRELAPALSSRLTSVITKCLQKEPRQRYQCVAELRSELSGERALTPPDRQTRSGKWRRKWLVAAGLLILLVAGVVAVRWRMAKANGPKEMNFTTSSPEALHLFLEARSAAFQSSKQDPIPLYKRAIELDPDFAVAHLNLGLKYVDAGKVEDANREISRAYELRGHASRPEQAGIEAGYYEIVTGELDKAVMSFEEMSRLRPDSPYPHMNLANIFLKLGQYDGAEAEAKETARLGLSAGYRAWSMAMYGPNRLNESKELLKQAEAHGYAGVGLYSCLYMIALFQSDEDGMAQQMSLAMADPYANEWAVKQKGDTAVYQGRFKQAWQYYSVAPGFDINSFGSTAVRAKLAVETGDILTARKESAHALQLPFEETRATTLAIVLARLGQAQDAEKLLQQINEAHPLNTRIQKMDLPNIWAAIELSKNNPFRAITILANSVPYDLGEPVGMDPMYSVYLRGLAFLELNQGRDAAIEFRKMVDHPGILQDSVLSPLSHLWLARAQAMMGDKDAARKAYQDFLTLWKDADPDIPIYKQAKAEYARLNKLPATSRKLPAKSRQLSAVSHQ